MTSAPDRLLILSRHADRYRRLLASEHVPDLVSHAAERAEDARNVAREATIILGDPDLVSAVLPAACSLKWVQSTFAGVDALPLAIRADRRRSPREAAGRGGLRREPRGGDVGPR